MEKKITQRIVGIVVVTALIVILMPLLFSKNDNATTQTVSVKAPPFPEEVSSPTTASPTDQVSSPSVTSPKEEQNVAAPSPSTVPIPAAPPAHPVSNAMNNEIPKQNVVATPTQIPQQTPPVSSTPTPIPAVKPINEVNSEISAEPLASNTPATHDEPAADKPKSIVPTDDSSLALSNEDEEPIENSASPVKNEKIKNAHTHTKVKHGKAVTLNKSPSLLNLKRTAWVVQLGSFKDKNNARRLADKLRVAGYKAFMREVKSTKGSVQTRVYIGPEYKQASINKLSTKLAHEMNLRGFVIPYKPLEL